MWTGKIPAFLPDGRSVVLENVCPKDALLRDRFLLDNHLQMRGHILV